MKSLFFQIFLTNNYNKDISTERYGNSRSELKYRCSLICHHLDFYHSNQHYPQPISNVSTVTLIKVTSIRVTNFSTLTFICLDLRKERRVCISFIGPTFVKKFSDRSRSASIVWFTAKKRKDAIFSLWVFKDSKKAIDFYFCRNWKLITWSK